MSRNQTSVALAVGLGMVLIAALAAVLVFWTRRGSTRRLAVDGDRAELDD